MSNEKQHYVVLKVVDGDDGFNWLSGMATYSPQVATVHGYDSPEKAACFNVGSYPDYDRKVQATPRRSPYRTIVIPWEHWQEFEVFSETIHGRREFRAYPSDNPTLQRGR